MTFLDFLLEQWILFSLLAALVVAFFILESKKGGTVVSHHESTRLVNAGEAVILDVRDASEFRGGHISGAINIPYTKLKDKYTQLEKHKSKKIIVVDKMGQHAGAAGKILRDNGYHTLRLQGGISEWSHQNLPLVKA